MSGPPEHQAAEARRWLKWAREDLTLAEHTAANPDVARRGACMWAHQAAEKALKAALIAAGVDPPKVHDLTRLARMLEESLHERLNALDLAELTRWSIEGRYPGDIEQASATDAKAALDTARAVVHVIGESLPVVGSNTRDVDAPEPRDEPRLSGGQNGRSSSSESNGAAAADPPAG